MLLLSTSSTLIISLFAENLARFPTEEDCLNELRKHIKEKCNHCHSVRLLREVGRRDARCLKCNRKTWLTARTFFSSIKKARPYLMAITLLGNSVEISGAAFGRLVNVSTSSALHILKKVSTVILKKLDLRGTSAPSSDFTKCVIRRSTETPSRAHPRAEFDEINRKLAQQTNHANSVLETLGEDEKTVYKLFVDKPLSVQHAVCQSALPTHQVISALSMLEITGLLEQTNALEYAKSTQTCAIPTIQKKHRNLARYVKRNLDLIRWTHRGISRKYLQLYLALSWCLLDKQWNTVTLLKACCKFGPLPEKLVETYVSPPMVQVCRVL